MVRARISLPDPVSPVINTDAEDGETCSKIRMTSCMVFDPPIRSPSLPVSRNWRVSASTCRRSRTRPIARSSKDRNTAALSGFSIYQNAPASIAAMTRSSLPLPVIMMAGTVFNSSPSLASRSSPFIPGNSTSAIKTVGANSVKRASASSALPTPRTSWPHLRSRASYPIRAFSSSSTIRTRSGAGFMVSKRVGSAIQFMSGLVHTGAASHFESTSSSRPCQAQITVNHTARAPRPHRTDAAGNFWLFGGFDLDSTGSPAALNDLWEFSGGQWTWKSGANVVNQTGVYGTIGVAAATNVPGARWSSAAWTDVVGNLWLFGGQGYDSTGNGSLSDLWAYTGGQWVWVKGPASVSQGGIYGGTPGPIIYPYVGDNPGSRFAPAYWIDPLNQFWMFGGEGFDSGGTNGNGLLNDLWRYLPYPNFPSQN